MRGIFVEVWSERELKTLQPKCRNSTEPNKGTFSSKGGHPTMKESLGVEGSSFLWRIRSLIGEKRS